MQRKKYVDRKFGLNKTYLPHKPFNGVSQIFRKSLQFGGFDLTCPITKCLFVSLSYNLARDCCNRDGFLPNVVFRLTQIMNHSLTNTKFLSIFLFSLSRLLAFSRFIFKLIFIIALIRFLQNLCFFVKYE